MDLILIVLGAAMLLGLTLLALAPKVKRSHSTIDKQLVLRKWQEITTLGNHHDQSARFAIIEADKLLDYALKQRGYSGETMGERLKSAGGDLSSKDDIWQAHKLRNRLVHEAEYELSHKLISRALSQFHQGLKDLRAL